MIIFPVFFFSCMFVVGLVACLNKIFILGIFCLAISIGMLSVFICEIKKSGWYFDKVKNFNTYLNNY